jgi:hypothetical protein
MLRLGPWSDHLRDQVDHALAVASSSLALPPFAPLLSPRERFTISGLTSGNREGLVGPGGVWAFAPDTTEKKQELKA